MKSHLIEDLRSAIDIMITSNLMLTHHLLVKHNLIIQKALFKFSVTSLRRQSRIQFMAKLGNRRTVAKYVFALSIATV